MGYDSIGFEINPYPAMVAEAKIRSLNVNINELDRLISLVDKNRKMWAISSPPAGFSPPPLKTKIPFFSPSIEKQVLNALIFINSVENEDLALLAKSAFGAILVKVSNYTYEPSLGTRPGAGKELIEKANFGKLFIDKLNEIRNDIYVVKAGIEETRIGNGKIVNTNFFKIDKNLYTSIGDIAITSPPYLNNYHYIRNTRPHLYWLSFISKPQEQKEYEEGNFGKFWQNVRGLDPIQLNFRESNLEGIITELRSRPDSNGIYGAAGWANYVVSYFNDIERYLSIISDLLKPSGISVTVIGNSFIQGINIPVDEIMSKIALDNGFELVDSITVREKRTGSSIIRSNIRTAAPLKAILYEKAVILRKTK
jgi:hypothetical protein